MIENKTDTYVSRIQLKFIVDNIEDFDKPISSYVQPSEIVRLMGEPDMDGKFRFLVEVIRISGTITQEEQHAS
jgi:hypothetical protein